MQRKAFTLIELLVVIAIIAILAAILFPVFAQAKVAAKKAVDLSNTKQIMLSVFIYGNDNGDLLPITTEYEPYNFMTRLLPYTKSRAIFKIPAGTAPQGTLERKQHDNGFDDYMLPSDDGCVDLGTSKVGTAGWYEDVYIADDYNVNKVLFGYKGKQCTRRYGYFQPAPSITSGSPSGDGQTGIGPGLGFTTFTSPTKVVLISNFPENGLQWPGGSGVSFWGSNFKSYWSEEDNVGHMDGHAKYYKSAQLMPPGQDGEDTGTGPYGSFLALTLCGLKPTESFVPPISEAVVYEVNLRALAPSVGFKTLHRRLSGLKALGVNVLWLMPVQPIGKVRATGKLGSPYAISNYDLVNQEFGDALDLQRLVLAAHRLKMAVVLDWVADHTSWDHPWIKSHSDWYLKTPRGEITSPPGTGWWDVAALDYRNTAMRAAMVSSMQAWISKYNVDGFRCDAADRLPLEFWKKAIKTLRTSTPKRLLMVAEGFKTNNYAAGFDLTYGWNFCQRLRDVYNGKPATEISSSANLEQNGLPFGAQRLRFITNHDISAFDGSTEELYRTKQGARTAFTIAALYGGIPLIYVGQEVDWDKRIPIFDESEINWKTGLDATRWMTQLMELRSQHPSLRLGTVSDFSTSDLVCFSRSFGTDQTVVLANVRNHSATGLIPNAMRGKWQDGQRKVNVNLTSQLTLPPYECFIFVKTKT